MKLIGLNKLKQEIKDLDSNFDKKLDSVVDFSHLDKVEINEDNMKDLENNFEAAFNRSSVSFYKNSIEEEFFKEKTLQPRASMHFTPSSRLGLKLQKMKTINLSSIQLNKKKLQTKQKEIENFKNLFRDKNAEQKNRMFVEFFELDLRKTEGDQKFMTCPRKKVNKKQRKNKLLKKKEIEQVVGLKRSLSQDHFEQNLNLNSLYDNFFIIGCKNPTDYLDKEKKVKFECLFAEKSSSIKDFEKNILKFFIPFSTKMIITESQSNYDEVQNIFRQNQTPHFFVVKLNSTIDNIKLNSLTHKLLKENNPEIHYYFYILQTEEFFFQEHEDKLKILNYPVYYIIRSYYPFSVLFKKILLQFYQIRQQKRLDKYLLLLEENIFDLKELKQIDSLGLLQFDIDFWRKILFDLSNHQIIGSYNQKITLNNSFENFTYFTPSFKMIPFAEAEFGYQDIFSFLPFEEFFFIYLTLIKELSIIVVSDNATLTTSFITTFQSLLHPFEWQFPTIYNLPEDCLTMLSSPIPLLIGIKMKSEKFIQNVLQKLKKDQNFPNSVFVYLDESLIVYQEQQIKNYVIPSLKDFYKNLKLLYQTKYNKIQSTQFQIKEKDNSYKLKAINSESIQIKLEQLAMQKKNLTFIEKMKYKNIKSWQIQSSENLNQIFPKDIFFFFKEFHKRKLINQIVEKNQIFLSKATFNPMIDLSSIYSDKNDLQFFQDIQKSQFYITFFEKEFGSENLTFKKIENLDEFTELKVLYIEGNCIEKLENLDNNLLLRCLYIQENLINKIENLKPLFNLINLNLNDNFITTIENLDKNINLESLQIKRNRIGINGISDIVHLEKLKKVSSLDISNNQIDCDPEEFIKILQNMNSLAVLYLQNNPICKKIQNYRKNLIASLPNLKYLDDRPVFPEDRRYAEAFARGGMESEREERKKVKEEKEQFHREQHEAFRKRFIDKVQQEENFEQMSQNNLSLETSKLETYNTSEISQEKNIDEKSGNKENSQNNIYQSLQEMQIGKNLVKSDVDEKINNSENEDESESFSVKSNIETKSLNLDFEQLDQIILIQN